MCGIVGIIKKSMPVSQEELISMNNSQIHRGPDGEGYYIHKNLGIAHRRLSIIDVENGSQPMFSEDKQIIITYNGELYNFKEIKDTLINLKYSFKTESDTEVIIYAYKEWGSDCVKKFRGMFAFAIIDHEKEEVFLARDHFGIKPLNYRIGKDYFAFASEIPALVKMDAFSLTGSLKALNLFLKFNYIPNPYTIYNEIYKLEPGHYLRIDNEGKIIEKKQYYDIVFSKKKDKSKIDSNLRIQNVIKNSVSSHLISDVSFGSFLSGGIDSTLITSEMSKVLNEKVNAFSIGFNENEFNEVEFAKFAAETINTNLKFEYIDKDSLLILPKLINNHFGEPFGDSSVIPTYFVSKLAAKKVKMVLTGDGGDEFFAGYSRYQTWLKNSPKNILKSRIKNKAIFNSIRFALGSLRFYINNRFSNNSIKEWIGLVSTDELILKSLLLKDLSLSLDNQNDNPFYKHHLIAYKTNRLSYAQYLDIKTYLTDDILYKVDVTSMANSLETRTPLIDIQVAESAFKLPQKLLINIKTNNGKMILKYLLSRKFPKSFVDRKKQGFAIPTNTWFRSEIDHKMFNEYLFGNKSDLECFFNIEKVKTLYEKYDKSEGEFLYFQTLWMIFIFSIWRSENMHILFK
jgi:asparagine synthase (glutamine-hydrolysing)